MEHWNGTWWGGVMGWGGAWNRIRLFQVNLEFQKVLYCHFHSVCGPIPLECRWVCTPNPLK